MKHKLYQIFLSSRPVSWINTAYPFAAAYVVTAHKIDFVLLSLAAIYFLIPYNLLMYGVNDVFDYESDIKNPRKGGIEGAKLTREAHAGILWSALLLNLPFLAYLFFVSNLAAAICLALLIFFVLAYSVPKLRFKEKPFLDSITSSIHFVGPAVFALALTGFNASFLPIIASFFLWGAASHAFGAVQDIKPDRAGGLASIATRLGAKRTVRLAIVLYALSALFLLPVSPAAAFISATLLIYVGNIAPYASVTDEDSENTNRAWRRFIFINFTVGMAVTFVLIHSYLTAA